jgi:hypothetical protein
MPWTNNHALGNKIIFYKTTFTDIQVPPSDGGGEAALPPCAVFATADRATSCGQAADIA